MRAYRKCEYYKYKSEHCKPFALLYLIYKCRYEKWKLMTGFDIPLGCLGYATRIGHCSPIIINGNTKIGNYCCLQNCITIGDSTPKTIGDHVYIASNVTISKDAFITDGCKISANSFVNRPFNVECFLFGGVPAKPIKQTNRWTDEQPYKDECERVEQLRKEMNLWIE